MSAIRGKISCLLLLLFLCSYHAYAGDRMRVPVVSKNPLHLDLYAHVSTGWYSIIASFPAQVSSGFDGTNVAPGLGIGVHGNHGLSVQVNFGYKYLSLGGTGRDAIPTHWCYYDIQVCSFIVTTGYMSDILVQRELSAPIPTQYSGFNYECLHRMTHVLYGGLRLPLGDANLTGEFRIGAYLQSPIDAERLSRYTMYKNSYARAGQFYMELKLSYRLFTTGRNKIWF